MDVFGCDAKFIAGGSLNSKVRPFACDMPERRPQLELGKEVLQRLDAPPIAAVGRNSNISRATDRGRLPQSGGGNLR